MEYKIYKAKTVNDAITDALVDLEITSDMIEYEVVEEGSSGLLGFFSKEAVIKARKKEEAVRMDEEEEVFDFKAQLWTEPGTMLNSQKAKPAKKAKNTGSAQEARKARPQAEKAGKEENTSKEEKPERPAREESSKNTEAQRPAQEEIQKTPDEPYTNQAILDVMQTIFRKLDIEAEITMTINKGERTVNIVADGEDTGDLIGKRGQTLDAIQYLLSIIINQDQESYYRVKLDTNNYRERRQKTLENLARNVAAKVKKTRRKVVMEPMNPYERRVIHSYLQADKYVTTKSEGVEPNRRVVVYYKKS